MKARQVQLPGFNFKTAKPFGGLGLNSSGLSTRGRASQGRDSHPNTARPFHSKMAMHVVLKSSRATSESSLLFHGRVIEKILKDQSKIFGVKLYESANAGNHLHLVIRAHSRRALRGYLRAISGIIARRVTGAERGAGRMKKSSAAKGDLPGQKSRVSFSDKSSSISEVAADNYHLRSPASRLTFWDARPFSRLVTWGRDYARIKNYLQINRNEMTGIDRLSARAMLARIKDFQRSMGLVSLGFG